jgi:TetR/AcrR family transcriptional regulator
MTWRRRIGGAMISKRPQRRGKGRKPAAHRDAEATRLRILHAAARHFAEQGLNGGRVDAIAAAASVNIRMIYHHFGSKRGLYVAVLDDAYLGLRQQELRLDYSALRPLEGLLRFFEFLHGHFAAHPELISLMTGENLLRATYLKRSTQVTTRSSPVIALIAELLRRGEASGEIRRGIDPLQLYVAMVALSYFHLSNAHTLSWIFRSNLQAQRWRHVQAGQAREMIERFLKSTNA